MAKTKTIAAMTQWGGKVGIGLEKPDYLKGGWDFYDIHYTLTAHKMGFENKTIPIAIVHHSPGELVGRDSWHINKDLLYNKNEKEFPFIC